MPEAAIGLLRLELRMEHSHSLKDKRQVVRSLKDRLRHKFNVAVAETGGEETWQRATVCIVTVSGDRAYAEEALNLVEADAAAQLGPMLVGAQVEFL
jgi:uncharacterized protein YlxP (DUF503 family)